MVGEVHYWRDMARILEAVSLELKQSYVEVSLQILAEIQQRERDLKPVVDNFFKEKSKILKGEKEAKWNNKYMKIIEKPV